ncbi:MAG: hypothetical protein IID45_02275, partial [Planctomycetes bacterium]|nr:hypothetical protein [Planctomycetota bacterium]
MLARFFGHWWTFREEQLSKSIPLIEATVDRNSLHRKPTPVLEIAYTFLNASLIDIVDFKVAGGIRFAGVDLSGQVEPKVSRKPVRYLETTTILITKFISKEEAELICSSPTEGNSWITFLVGGLHIYAMLKGIKTPVKLRTFKDGKLHVRTRSDDKRWKVQ